MSSARQEKIASRARREHSRNVRRLTSLARFCDHAPTWQHLIETRNGDALGYEIQRELAASQYMPGVLGSNWQREGTR